MITAFRLRLPVSEGYQLLKPKLQIAVVVHLLFSTELLATMIASQETNTIDTPKGHDLPGPWAKTYQATTKEELLDAYAEWSKTYDVDSIQRFGYLGPKRAAEELVKYLTGVENPTIADIGAGTGLVGEELFAMLNGKCRIIAIDYSPEMLKIAEEKGCYSKCQCVDLLQQRSEVENEAYDAVISVGTFTPNHLGKEALDQVVTMVKPNGGIVCLSLREDFVNDSSNGFLQKLEQLEECGVLNKIHVTSPELYTRKISDDIYFRCWIYFRVK